MEQVREREMSIQDVQIKYLDSLPQIPNLVYTFIISCRNCHIKQDFIGIELAKQFVEAHRGHYTWISKTERQIYNVVQTDSPLPDGVCPKCLNRGWVVENPHPLLPYRTTVPCSCPHRLPKEQIYQAVLFAIAEMYE